MSAIDIYTLNAEHAEKLREAVAEAGGVVAGSDRTVRWNNQRKVYEGYPDTVDKKTWAKIETAIADFVKPEAKEAWEKAQAERPEKLVETARESAKGEAKRMDEDAKRTIDADPRPKLLVYPVEGEERDAFKAKVKDLGIASYRYDAKVGAFVVPTDKPEEFARWTSEEAKGMWKAAFEARNMAAAAGYPEAKKRIEAARGEAAKRAGNAFFAQYSQKGFRLARPTSNDPEKAEAQQKMHAQQLDQMNSASVGQLKFVSRVNTERLTVLRDRERELRAKAVGLTPEELKGVAFKDLPEAAKAPVLSADEQRDLHSLQRGLDAIREALKQREGVEEKKELGREAAPAAEASVAKSKTAAKDKGAEKASAPAPASVSSEASAAALAANLSQRARRNKAAGL